LGGRSSAVTEKTQVSSAKTGVPVKTRQNMTNSIVTP